MLSQKGRLWSPINEDLELKLLAISRGLNKRSLSTAEAAVAFSDVVTQVLTDHGLIEEKTSSNYRPRKIERTIDNLAYFGTV